MFLASKAKLSILDEKKLQISRHPRIVAWLIFGLSGSLFTIISYHLIDNIFMLIIWVIGEIMFGLDLLGEWEKYVLDKTSNQAIFTRCNWIDKLCSTIPEKSTTSMKLSDIRHVGVSMNLGLFILQKNGNTVSLVKSGLTREEVQDMKKKVNYFLNLSRIECLDKIQTDLHDHLLISSDSEEDILNVLPEKLKSEEI